MFSSRIVQQRLERLEQSYSAKLGKPFRLIRYSRDESLERSAGVCRAYDLAGKQLRDLTQEELDFVLNEINLVKWDFEYATRYMMISGSAGNLLPFEMRPSQRKMLNKLAELEEAAYPLPAGKSALIIAKARRVGATVLGEAAVAHSIMFRSQAKGLVASCEPTNSLELFKILTRIYDNLPPWIKPAIAGRVKSEHVYFPPPLDSDITIGHGNQLNPMGQGVRLDAVHLTELSAWKEVGTKQIEDDIWPAFNSSQAPSTFLIIESTGESVMDGHAEWFETKYKTAKAGKGFYRSLFLGWYDCPELHTADATGLTFSETTLAAAGRIERETGITLSREQLAFYQLGREEAEANGNLSGWLHQYPALDEDCFLYGQPSAWPAEVIYKVQNDLPSFIDVYDVEVRKKKLVNRAKPSTWDNDPNNKVFIWEYVRPGFTYVIGVDVAYGLDGKDSSCVFVNRVGNKTYPDRQVAEFASDSMAPDDLAAVCWILGHMYTDSETGMPALMAIETNPGSPGMQTQSELIKMGYPNFYLWRVENRFGGGMTNQLGWKTSGSTRPLLTKKGVKAVREGELKISSPWFVEEMKTFVNYGFQRFRGVDGYEYFAHAPGRHDDRIMAGFIAFYVSHDYDQESMADERRKLQEAVEARAKPKVSIRDYQNTVMTWDEALAEFEDRLPF